MKPTPQLKGHLALALLPLWSVVFLQVDISSYLNNWVTYIYNDTVTNRGWLFNYPLGEQYLFPVYKGGWSGHWGNAWKLKKQLTLLR